MKRLRRLWDLLLSSLWFVPTLLVLAAIVLAVVLIEVDGSLQGRYLQERWPRLFGAGAGGSRDMLAAIATSMITVAGVAFSITIVALSLASTQYTSRVVRNFMRDRANQVVLGSFVGIFVYCLVVLRTLREGEHMFNPALAVLFAVVLALLGIGCLIFFIHHIALSIQAESILKSAAEETIDAVRRLFPVLLADSEDAAIPPSDPPSADDPRWRALASPASGYLVMVDDDALVAAAVSGSTVIRMEKAVGDFVIEGEPILSVIERTSRPANSIDAAALAACVIECQRTMVQDVGFGIRQIVDVALRALSPGINDTTTAIASVQWLAVILSHLAARRMGPGIVLQEGQIRLICRSPGFADMVNAAFRQIRQHACDNAAVLESLIGALDRIAIRTTDPGRRAELADEVRLLAKTVGCSRTAPHDLEGVGVAIEELACRLEDRECSEDAARLSRLGTRTTRSAGADCRPPV
jgi:uncharacterized membrane protein